jgi:hypothetical protein
MVDRYTKSVLTVIAAALVAIAAQSGIRFAQADVEYNDACGTPTHPVCQVTWANPLPVKVVPSPQ